MWRFITKNSAAMNGGATKTRRSAALKGRAAMSVVILAMGLVVILMMGLVMGLGIGAPVFAQKTGGASEIPIGVVSHIYQRPGELTKTISVRPAVNFTALEFVLVVTRR